MMSSLMTVLLQVTIFLALISAFVQAEEVNNYKKLDEGPSELENKCGGCPCDNPCNPVPSPPPPSPPPPPKQPQPTNYCPPPPAPTSGSSGGGGSQKPPNPPYIYVNGPPGNVYPIHPYYSSDGGRSFSMGMTFFISTTILWLLYISF